MLSWRYAAGADLEVFPAGAEQQWRAAAHHVRCHDEQKEGRVVGENVVEQLQPLIPCQHLREEGFQERPSVQLQDRQGGLIPAQG